VPLYLIDASIYIFRAWFSLPSQLTDNNQQPVNAAYGFTKFLTEFLETTSAKRVVVAFDESLTHSFRNEIYPPYKMNRELPPEELKNQFALCKELVAALGISSTAHDRYEADDLIGTLAHAAKQRGEKLSIVSADKDLAQLLGEHDVLWDFARRQEFSPAGILEKFGVKPNQIVDYLGLQVTQMDVRGAKGMAEKLRVNKEQAFLSKQLATIALDAPIDTSEDFTKLSPLDIQALHSIVVKLGGRGEGLIQRMVNSLQQA